MLRVHRHWDVAWLAGVLLVNELRHLLVAGKRESVSRTLALRLKRPLGALGQGFRIWGCKLFFWPGRSDRHRVDPLWAVLDHGWQVLRTTTLHHPSIELL